MFQVRNERHEAYRMSTGNFEKWTEEFVFIFHGISPQYANKPTFALSWSELASVCTDGAPSMRGKEKGFVGMKYPISSVSTASAIRSHWYQSSEMMNSKI